MNTDHADVHKLLGAYVLGGLDEGEQELFRAHLATCSACTAELALAAPLPGLLRRAAPPGRVPSPVGASDTPAREDSLEHLLHRVRAQSRVRHRRVQVGGWLALAAALVTVAGLGLAFLGPGAGGSVPAGHSFTAVPGSAVTGSARWIAKPWGTALTIDVAHLPPGGPFTLTVAADDGRTEQAAEWGAAPAHTAKVSAATSIHPEDIRSLSVAGPQGHVLAVVRSPS